MTSLSVIADQENIVSNRLQIKQNGVERLQSTKKKNALADVKNTLHGRCTAKEAASKNQVVKASEFEHCDVSVKDVSSARRINKYESNIADLCCCPDHPDAQDDYSDILFRHIRLSKNQIESLAMEWEKTPLYNQIGKREEDLPEAATFDIDYDLIEMNWPSKDIDIKEDFEVPPPELDDDLLDLC